MVHDRPSDGFNDAHGLLKQPLSDLKRYLGITLWSLAIVLSAIGAPPVFKDRRGVVGQVLGGWSFAPIFEARTGTPFTVFDCTNAFNTCPRYAPLAGGPLPLTGNTSSPPQVEPNTFNYLVRPPRLDYGSPLFASLPSVNFPLSDYGLCTAPGQAAPNDCPFPAGMTSHLQEFQAHREIWTYIS